MTNEYLDAKDTKWRLRQDAGHVRLILTATVRQKDYSELAKCKQRLVTMLERFCDSTTYKSSSAFNPDVANRLTARVNQVFVDGVTLEQLEEVLGEVDVVTDAYAKEHGLTTQAEHLKFIEDLFGK